MASAWDSPISPTKGFEMAEPSGQTSLPDPNEAWGPVNGENVKPDEALTSQVGQLKLEDGNSEAASGPNPHFTDAWAVDDDKQTAKLGDQPGWAKALFTDNDMPVKTGGVLNANLLPEWLSNAAKYEWKDEFGDVGPEDPELEAQIFHPDLMLTAGEWVKILSEIQVHQEGPKQVKPIKSFDDAALHPLVLENLKKCGYQFPMPIQAFTIPAVLEKRDILAVAQTGSGKTMAYLAPIISMLMGKAKKLAKPKPIAGLYDPKVDAIRAEPLVLILCPTRELALQIFNEARKMCYRSFLRPCVLHGGGRLYEQQIADLQRGCDILIGTTGRVRDMMLNRAQWLSMCRVKYKVIDEADELVQDDWRDDVREIMFGSASHSSDDQQYLMFSATFPQEARHLAEQLLASDHAVIHVGRLGSSHENIHQVLIHVDPDQKYRALKDLMGALPASRTLIFCNSKFTCDKVEYFLAMVQKIACSVIHGDRDQRMREEAITAFRSATVPVLITTDVLGRGMDIPNIMHVIQFDLARNITEYVHRIGRTARIGNRGQATSFFTKDDWDMAEDLIALLKENKHILPEFMEAHLTDPEAERADTGTFEGAENNDANDARNGSVNAETNDQDDGWGAPANAESKADDANGTETFGGGW